VDRTGTLTGTASYQAWGAPETAGGLTATTPFGYAGAYADVSGLLYLIQRYYDPATGQFLSVDPEIAQTQQPYQYANDNPISYADPSGTYPDCKAGVSEWHLVAKYRFKKAAGGLDYAYLLCGNSKWGFRHIEQSDKGKRISNFPGKWPGFDYSITTVERTWTHYKCDDVKKACKFWKKMYECDSAENWYKPYWFNVVNTVPVKDYPRRRIITAWPEWGTKHTGACPTG
jgi:RHS repeat-associated protein